MRHGNTLLLTIITALNTALLPVTRLHIQTVRNIVGLGILEDGSRIRAAKVTRKGRSEFLTSHWCLPVNADLLKDHLFYFRLVFTGITQLHIHTDKSFRLQN